MIIIRRMTSRARLIVTVSIAVITSVSVLKRPIAAQGGGSAAGAFTLEHVLNYPFPDNLVSARQGHGDRLDVQRARRSGTSTSPTAPDFAAAPRSPPYQRDDGQELTNLAFSPRRQDDRLRARRRPRLELAGRRQPAAEPGGQRGAAARCRCGRCSTARRRRRCCSAKATSRRRADAATASRSCKIAASGLRRSTARSRPNRRSSRAGSSESPTWSPDGRRLGVRVDPRRPQLHRRLHAGRSRSATSRRRRRATRRRYGRRTAAQIAFVRQPGRGGTPRSPLVQQPAPWAIWVGDAEPADR